MQGWAPATLSGWPVRRLLALLLLVALPLLAFELYAVAELRATRELEVKQEAGRLRDLVEAEQQRITDDIRHTLVALTEMGIGELDASGCAVRLERMKPRFPSYVTIDVSGRDGTIRCSTEPERVGRSTADRLFHQEALATDDVVSGRYLVTRTTDQPVVPFARAFRRPDGSAGGAVTILLSIHWLEQYLAQKALPPGAAVLIADRGGTVLARVPELPGLSGQPLPERFQPLLAAEQKGMYEMPGLDGTQRITAYSPPGVGGRDIFIQVGLDKGMALRPVNANALRSLLIFAGLFLLAVAGAVWGIGRLVRAQRRAEESALKTARVLASTVDGVVEIDRAWRFTYLNDKAKSLIAEGRDLRGEILWEAFPELVGSTVWDMAHRAVTERVPTDAEFHGTRTGRWFWMRAFPSADGMAVYLLDISRRRRAEEALRESKDRLSFALESAHAGTFEWDLRTGEGHWSEESYRIFGLDPAAHPASTASWLTIVHPEDLEAASLSSQQQLFTERRPDFLLEYRVVHPDGTIRWVSTIGRVNYDADGTPMTSSGLNIDVTERQALAEALRRSEERLGIALAAAEAGLWDMDLRTQTVTWSEGMYRLFGVEPASFTPTEETFFALIHPEDREAVHRINRATAAAGLSEYRTEFRILHPLTGERWILGIGRSARDGAGKIVRLSGLNIDITERKAMEQALREAKAKADEANLSKSKFLAAASHDLRQPLQSALLFAGVLHQHVQDPGRGPLASLERTLDTLKELLDSLLDVSRLEAGVVVPKLEDLPLCPLLRELGASYAPVAASKGLELRLDCPDPALAVRSDRLLLERMVRNLLENAVRYTENGHIRLACSADGGRVRITVEDSGIGIPPEHMNRVFEEFHQVGNIERDRSRGLGLGLAIVQRLSVLLGHPVAVRSEPGRGSVFTIDLPAAESPKAASTPAPETAADGSGSLAVLIDDDVMVLTGMRTMFREWGYDVVIAGSADQAVERLTPVRRVPDIVVADYRLREGKVGTDAIERVRALVGQPVPGIILTGEIGPECERDAAAHGLSVIHKPVTPRQLRASVQGVLRKAG